MKPVYISGLVKKSYWSVLSICFLGALTYNIFAISATFFSFPVNVAISLEHEEELVFPAVSICNMSPGE